MNEDLHKEDEPFKKAYENSEEPPSPHVWSQLEARLNERDAVYYRRKFTAWKSIACVLIFMLSSVSLYNIYEGNTPSFSHAKEHDKNKHAINSDSIVTIQPHIHSKVLASMNNKQPATTRSSPTPDNDSYKLTAKRAVAPFAREQIKTDDVLANGFTMSEEKPFLVQQKNDKHFFFQREKLEQNFEPNKTNNDTSFTTVLPIGETLIYGIKKRFDTTPKSRKNFHFNNESSDTAIQQSVMVNELKKTRSATEGKLNKSFTPNWTIAPYISTDFTAYRLDDDISENPNSPLQKQAIEKRENHEFSFSAGILARWQFFEILGAKTGLIYSNIAIGIQPQTLYASNDGNQDIAYKFVTSSGYAYVKPVFIRTPVAGDSIFATVAQHHLQYISVPLMFTFRLPVNKRFTMIPSAGILPNVLLSTKVRTEVDEGNDKETVTISRLKGLQTVYMSFSADAEIQYKLSKRLNISLLPTFKSAMRPMTKNNVVKTYPYSLGLGAGISMNL